MGLMRMRKMLRWKITLGLMQGAGLGRSRNFEQAKLDNSGTILQSLGRSAVLIMDQHQVMQPSEAVQSNTEVASDEF